MSATTPAVSPSAPATLHCRSNFSFQLGASHPEELVREAAALGHGALALTDECSLAGVVRAHQAIRADALPLRLIIGTRLALDDGTTLLLLATDRAGYGRLSRLISLARRQADKGHYRLERSALDDGLPGCLALLLPHPDDARTAADLRWLKARFADRGWLGVGLYCGADDAHRLTRWQHLGDAAGVPLAAAPEVRMHRADRQPIADLQIAIGARQPLARLGTRLPPNAERCLHPPAVLARRYPPELLAQAREIAARCRFSLDELRYEYPDELAPPGIDPHDWLCRWTEAGLRWRHGVLPDHAMLADAPPPPEPAQIATLPDPVPPRVRAMVAHELALIGSLHYAPYFLTVHDIVRFARRQGILCQGRGSAANSVVCWALGITEVSPELGIMLIERFISRERNEPPDIDIDFDNSRREEVLQYVYRRYGRNRAALTATVITYRPRSALRDSGRALGIDEARLDTVTARLHGFDGRDTDPERLREAGLNPDAPLTRRWLDLAGTLIGFPRHLSQHVGGMVIARGRLDELVPIENAAMPERTVIQWDKDDLDTVGLLKIDLLALGMLAALRRALALLAERDGRPWSLADIPREQPEVYEMLSQGNAVGVFQVESRAQLGMLPRLQPRRFYDLVVEVAIVRPGPIQGGMVHPYLRARERVRRHEDPLDGLRPELRTVLSRTLGVPIFQEQVMQLAMVAGGFTPGQADQLRRAMGAWRRKGELERYRSQLMAGMAANGYASEFAERLCAQIEGFGSYGFPESHAASFALLVYVSAWLKCFEPAVFLCALLNSLPMGFYAPAQLIQDAERNDVEVRPVDVNHSAVDSTLEDGAVRLGLNRIRGLDHDAAQRIATACQHDPFPDTPALARRAALDEPTLARLARAGALASLITRAATGAPTHAPGKGGMRRHALWQALGSAPLPGLLADTTIHTPEPMLTPPTEADDLRADYAALGFTLGRHPLALLRDQLAARRFVTAAILHDHADRQIARVCGLVTCRQRPGTAHGTLFLTLEDETGLINIIVRRELFEHQRAEALRTRLLGVFGQVSRTGEVIHVVAGRLVNHDPLLGSLDARSRDFH